MITNITDDIKLKPINLENANRIFKLIDINRALFSEWFPWVLNTTKITDTTKFIKAALKNIKDGKEFVTEIWYHNKIVGIVSLTKIDDINKKAEIGYWLDYKHHGKGIMTIATKSILNYGFTNFNLNRIAILICENNFKSLAIPKRLKLTQEGILRNYLTLNNEPKNYKVFSIVRNEWLNGLLEN